MILVVDDDPAMVELVCDVLTSDGLPVEGYTRPRAALAALDRAAPALVVSDVVMPELGGLELRRAYLAEHPDRDTPFVFLSSVADTRTIVRGLDDGAEDYLVKPVEPAVLLAKVRAILRRRARRAHQSFRGDLADLPLSALLRFCESKGLTGWVDVFHDGRASTLRFRGGRLDEGDAERGLDEILALTRAPFEIHSAPVDFDELRPAGARAAAPATATEAPFGRVSGVRRKQRLLQLSTQLAGGDEAWIVTLVTIEGRVVWKRRVAVPPGADRAAVQGLIDHQHGTVEDEVEAKLAAASAAGGPREPDRAADVPRLCDEGYDRFRAGDYEGAIARWREALALDPSAGSIAVNIKIASDKLARLNRPT